MTDEKLVLTPPEPVKPVKTESAAGLVPLDDAQRTELDGRAIAFVDELSALSAGSPEFGKKVEQLTNLGRREIKAAAEHSNRFLEQPVKAMDEDSTVGSDLTKLRRVIEDLDPKGRGDLLSKKKLLGLIPFGDKLRDYFEEYQSAQGHIAAILERLDGSKDELTKDNAAIDTERERLWHCMGKLEQMIHVAKALDAKLEAKANELDATDPDKAKAIRETALFYVRQRVTDLLTQMAVSVQGYLALDLVKKNNTELIKGVERASTTTVSALRTAVTVAQAMTNQKLVLNQISALNATTANIIESTSSMLSSQSAQIHEQAASSTVPLETIEKAFQNIYQTMDSIDSFKLQALDSMKSTVNTLSDQVEKSRDYIARTEGAAQASGEADEPFLLRE